MSRLRALRWVLPALGLAVACAGLPGREPAASEEERRAYAAALVPLASNPKEATRRLEAFVAAHPESPLVDDASLRRDIVRARQLLGRDVPITPEILDELRAQGRL